jgi:hypothetical protein
MKMQESKTPGPIFIGRWTPKEVGMRAIQIMAAIAGVLLLLT